jgi:hypothetical protein
MRVGRNGAVPPLVNQINQRRSSPVLRLEDISTIEEHLLDLEGTLELDLV